MITRDCYVRSTLLVIWIFALWAGCTKDNPTAPSSPPEANFVGNPIHGDAPLTVQFMDTSKGEITVWVWSFPGGDPSTAGGVGPHAVLYSTTGTFDVTLTATGPGGSDTETKEGYISVKPPPLVLYLDAEGTLTTQLSDFEGITVVTSSFRLSGSAEWSYTVSGDLSGTIYGIHLWAIASGTSFDCKIIHSDSHGAETVVAAFTRISTSSGSSRFELVERSTSDGVDAETSPGDQLILRAVPTDPTNMNFIRIRYVGLDSYITAPRFLW